MENLAAQVRAGGLDEADRAVYGPLAKAPCANTPGQLGLTGDRKLLSHRKSCPCRHEKAARRPPSDHGRTTGPFNRSVRQSVDFFSDSLALSAEFLERLL